MKKLITIFLVALSFYCSAQSDPEGIKVTAYEVLKTEGDLVIANDTVNSTTQMSSTDTVLGTKEYIDSKAAGLDSIMDIDLEYFSDIYLNGSVVDSFLIDSVYHAVFADTSKFSENSTYADTATVALNTAEQTVYSIVLPSSNSVYGRIQTPTSLPDGWTLTDDGINLIITHNLDRWSANVTVKSNTSGTIWDQQLNTAAYSYYSDLSSNQIKIYSLCTAYKPIRINIIFE